MASTSYQPVTTDGAFKPAIFVSLILIAIAAIAAYNMEHAGHYITGMNNRVIWGMPHVLAIFLIISASGALNIASIASVFDKAFYKPLARLSAAIAISLLIGGLAVILLDLGRPDRLIVAMTYYNFSSIFAWNIILYTGFVLLTIIYLWTMLDWQMERYKRMAGIAAFCWRLILTAGTGSIFGVLIAREAYHLIIMGPMFIVLSLGYGMAFYMIVACLFMPSVELENRSSRLVKLMANLIVCSLAASLIYHLSNWFWFDSASFERFILTGDQIYPLLIWVLQMGTGTVLPLLLLKPGNYKVTKISILLSSVLFIAGGIAQIYTLVIAGQAYPMSLLEGYQIESTFYGDIAVYTPSHWEILLGIGGFALALLLIIISLRLFRLLPESK
ncbi:MAG: polysulfide reductase NrfD [Gammaproteobacteria bacterium]|nr:polysulfide reductase NrfD [Gammaproteobacteria bacterium]